MKDKLYMIDELFLPTISQQIKTNKSGAILLFFIIENMF